MSTESSSSSADTTSSTAMGVTSVGGAASTSGSTTVATTVVGTTAVGTSGTTGGVAGNGGSGAGGAMSTSAAGGGTSSATSDDSTVGAGGSMGGSAGAGGSAAGGAGGGVGSGGDGGTGGASAYNPCPTASGSQCVVLPLGDSITEGCCASPYGGYRIELFRQAYTNQKGITFVGSLINGPTTVDGQTFPRAHEGHGGYTIDSGAGHSGISAAITQDALQNYAPHIVLLKIGTNDINGNVDINNAPGRLANLIDDIITRAPDALLVVSTIIPTTNDGTNQAVQTYNAAIPALVEERSAAGKHVVFVDNYANFVADSNYKTTLMADGLHPNDAGYVVLGQAFYDVIADFLPATQ